MIALEVATAIALCSLAIALAQAVGKLSAAIATVTEQSRQMRLDIDRLEGLLLELLRK